MSSSNAYVAMITKGRVLAIVVSPPPTITCTFCIIDRLEVMSEPLQLVSFAEAVWQMYITSFDFPCLCCAEFYLNSKTFEYVNLVAFRSYPVASSDICS